MKRGDLVIAAAGGDFGKLRPHLVIQADVFAAIPSRTVLPLTTDLQPAPHLRIDVEPTRENGLITPSQIMVDKAWTIPSRKISRRIGRLDRGTLLAVERALASFFGIG